MLSERDMHDIDYEELRDKILNVKPLTQKEQKELQVKRHSPNLVDESFEMNPKNIVPELISVNSSSRDWKVWKAIEEHVSSFPFRRSPGRNCYFIIRNKFDGKNLGIIDVAADFLSFGKRDSHIGWDFETRKKNNRQIANISVSVPTRNFGYNLSGGKLLTLLAASDEVANHWQEKYGDTLMGLTVTSLYGKSVQYNRLDYFKYLGKSQGTGTVQIPDEIYKEMRKVVENHEGKIPWGQFTSNRNSRIFIIRKACEYLGIDASALTTHGIQRGIYWCDRYKNTPELLCDIDTEPIPQEGDMSVDALAELWRHKWADRRIRNLKSRDDFNIIE